MNENFWKIAIVAATGCLQMTFSWGRFNAWSTITGIILLLLLLSIPWRTRFPWPERGAYAATFALAVTLAAGRLFENRLDPDLASRPRQIFAVWAVITIAVVLLKSYRQGPASD